MARGDRTLTLKVIGDVDSIKKDVASVNKSLGTLGKAAKVAGGVFAGAFAVDTVIDFAKGAMDAASDLSESLSKVRVVFGKSADDIEAWSRTSARSFGLSQQAALEAAGTYGNLFDALGLTEDASADMSKAAVQLAGDLASFNNTGVDEVLQAIQSGLLGEAEPMRRFGSSLSAARVEAYALSAGLVKNKKDLTDAIKVQARFALILQDTKLAQGDYGRTADNAANSQRTLDANIKNLEASIGGFLLGAAAGFTGWLNDVVESINGTKGASGVIGELAVKMEELGKATDQANQAQDPGAWLLQGTIFDSLVDGLNEAQQALLRGVNPLVNWVDQVEAAGKRIGATRDELGKLAAVVYAQGGNFEDFRQLIQSYVLQETLAGRETEALRGSIARLGDGSVTAGVKKSFSSIPPVVRSAVREVGYDLGALTDISKTTLRATRDEVKVGMQQIKDALSHPFRERRLEKEYRTAIRQGTAAMNKALKRGNAEAYAEAREFVRKYKAKLRELTRQKWRVQVEMTLTKKGFGAAGQKVASAIPGLGSLFQKPKKHRMGLANVPYDNYLAELHKGERVLTADENRRGMGSTYNITVNGFVGSEAQLGGAVVRAIQAYEKRGGNAWRRVTG